MSLCYKMLLIIICCMPIYSQGTGTIKGTLKDSKTKAPLIGANIVINNTNMGAAADSTGSFEIKNIPPALYSLKLSYISYKTSIITDVVVKPDRITFIEEELEPAGIEMGSIVVTGGYFKEQQLQPTSIINYSYEEIRRSPGAAGDVSRILMSLPSVAKVNDQSNSLIVRGGNPSENAFYIDNIEVPNINHFPLQGSSGGPIGMVNIDFIKNVNFYSGGFPALYGDRLSSVMELNFREGNREEIDGQLDLNFSGFGAVLEGPLFNKGSWLVSARRSYLDYLIKAIDIGTSIAPTYSDYQWKATYDLNSSHKLSFIGLIGEDNSESNEETAKENKMEAYGTQKTIEATTGLNWQAIWGTSGLSNTSISFNQLKFNEDYYKPVFATKLVQNQSNERMLRFRNVNHFNLNNYNSIVTGIDAKYHFSIYDNFYGETTDMLGNVTPAAYTYNKLNTWKTGAFVNYILNPIEDLTINSGIRADYFNYTGRVSFDPRISVSYKLNPLTTLNASAGIYHQNLPAVLLMQNPEGKSLKDPVANHYILGLDYLLTEDTKLTLEFYDKEYHNFPLDPEQPSLFIIDENIYNNIFYSYHKTLMDNGQAYTRGIEISLQKKLVEDIYGLASFTFFKSRYKSLDGTWKNRVFDNQFSVNIEGGYKINKEWEVSARWIFAGGTPYTPFDVTASTEVNTGILDLDNVNGARNSAYHSLNLRVDKRFNFEKSDLIVYLSVWNVYNQKNVAHKFWNSYDNKQDVIYQWTLLPIFGLEYEF